MNQAEMERIDAESLVSVRMQLHATNMLLAQCILNIADLANAEVCQPHLPPTTRDVCSQIDCFETNVIILNKQIGILTQHVATLTKEAIRDRSNNKFAVFTLGSKLPEFNPEWDEDAQSAWHKLLDKLIASSGAN